MDITYTVGDLKRVIAESFDEFKPVIGDGVESADKTNNREAYKMTKTAGAKEKDNKEPKVDKADGNKTMMSVRPENMDDKYKKRVKAQAKGYTSELEEKNDIEKDPSAEFNDREYNAFNDEAEEMDKNIENVKKSGLVSREIAKNDPDYFKKDSIRESVKPKTAYFKHTKFVSEAHMISRIPDELKNEGQVFHMKDNAGNDYTVKWSLNEAEILRHENKIQLNETMARMSALMDYNPKDYYKKNKR